MNAIFDTDHRASPKPSDFTVILGCLFLSILMTGGVVLTTRLVMILAGLQ